MQSSHHDIQNNIQDGWGTDGRVKNSSLPKIYHTYPAMIKLGTVIPYLRKFQKIYEPRDTLVEYSLH